MAEDRREDLEAGGETDSSLTPDESMVEPISDKSLVEKTSQSDDLENSGEGGEDGEYERSSTLPIKDDKPGQTDRAAMQINKYKKTFRSVSVSVSVRLSCRSRSYRVGDIMMY